MRSKVAERILNNYKSKPWWYRLRSWINIQLAVIKCLGFFSYVKANIVIFIKRQILKNRST